MPRSVDVSVVVPVYNDPVGVGTTLRALAAQTYPTDGYEVVVVDNGSEDETAAVVDRYRERYAFVRGERETRIQGSYAARNTGIDATTGSMLAFLDADVTVPSTWLESLVDLLAGGKHDYVGCAVEIRARNPDSAVAKYNRTYEFPVERYLRNYQFAPTCSLAVRREVVDAVGAFDTGLQSSGDKEFGQRVHAAGFDQHYASDVVASHPARSARELLAKYVRIGRGFEQLDRRYSDRFDHGPLFDRRNVLPNVALGALPESAHDLEERTTVDLDAVDLAAFFLLRYGTTLAETAGRIAERVRPTPLPGAPRQLETTTQDRS